MAEGDVRFDLVSRVARLEQHLQDLDQRLMTVGPVVTQIVALSERVDAMRHDLQEIGVKLIHREQQDAQHEHDERQERRALRRTLIAVSATLLTALITATVVLLQAPH